VPRKLFISCICIVAYSCAAATHLDSDKGRAIQHYDRALALYSKERHQDAIEEYQLALQSWGNYRDAHFGLGAAFIKTGFLRGAIIALNRAIELQAIYPEAYVNLGIAQAGLGRGRDATVSFLKALDQDADLQTAWFPLAQTYVSRGVPDSAITAYTRSVAAHPYEANAALARLYQASGEPARQLTHLKAAAESDTSRADSWIALGEYYDSSGRPGDATVAFELALSRDSEFPGLLMKLAGSYARARDHGEAARYFRRSIAQGPENPTAQFNLGAIYDAMGRHTDAVDAYRAAVAIQPDFADAYLNLAIDLMEMRSFPEALAAYEAFLGASEPSDARRLQIETVVGQLRTALGK